MLWQKEPVAAFNSCMLLKAATTVQLTKHLRPQFTIRFSHLDFNKASEFRYSIKMLCHEDSCLLE
jgi:hypothetical protein